MASSKKAGVGVYRRAHWKLLVGFAGFWRVLGGLGGADVFGLRPFVDSVVYGSKLVRAFNLHKGFDYIQQR